MKRILCVAAISLALSGCWEISKGDKVGIIVKCANEGVLVKTYECELIRGGMQDGSGSFGKSFHFTAENKSDLPMLEDALNNQREVHITYHQEWWTFPWRSETENNMFLDSIQIVPNRD